jgi:hypothetical protein
VVVFVHSPRAEMADIGSKFQNYKGVILFYFILFYFISSTDFKKMFEGTRFIWSAEWNCCLMCYIVA